ncbi:MAG: tRNA threonylcarbamoyladenosine dehydratase [Desulfocapsaceae bacterium]|jgi:tRNA A37 threonylcarbamoyladenosine dehydratase|nr:tRNA threonylcarbamoyladenosine dehydratase [Desulfocapsaceae bacterium]
MHRFIRTELLVGKASFARLSAAHVTVIGLGAVGGYAVEGLARAGIGKLTLVDFDTIQVPNINRQLYALESTIGQPKSAIARNRVLDINPSCSVNAMQLFADALTMAAVMEERPDILIDAIDSLNPKIQVLTASFRHGITTLSSMGAALRTDPSQIRIADISRTKNCPLARRVRKRLRTNDIEKGITCVFSTEQVSFEYHPPEEQDSQIPHADRGRARRTLGSLPTLTALFGLILANEAIRRLINPEKSIDEPIHEND